MNKQPIDRLRLVTKQIGKHIDAMINEKPSAAHAASTAVLATAYHGIKAMEAVVEGMGKKSTKK